MEDSPNRMDQLWKAIAIGTVSMMIGWWSRQFTLEIPPKWFRDRVDQNITITAQHERRLDELEKVGDLAEVLRTLEELRRQDPNR